MDQEMEHVSKDGRRKGYEEVILDDDEINEYCKRMPLTDETACGFWIFRSSLLQNMANKKVLVLVFGISSCVFGATFSYFNATISTMERVFRIPSRTIGIICSGNDIVRLFGSVLLNYYATKGHKPRWIAMGVFCSAVGCFLNAMPHLIYESGDDVLQWTQEYGGSYLINATNGHSVNKQLCGAKEDDECNVEDSNIVGVVYLFISQVLSGIGAIAIYSLGVSYLDDNVQKKKSPAFMSLMFFMRLVGPSVGFSLGTFCLSLYIRPGLHPTIEKDDPRWLGAWWLGWIILGAVLGIFSFIIGLFPKSLTRAAARKELIKRKCNQVDDKETAASFNDLTNSIKRLLKNRIYVLSQISAVMYIFGYMPFWTFLQKYMETMYRIPPPVASFYSGTFGLGSAALGTLLGGFLVQKFKPNSKKMAFCTALVSVLTLLCVFGYMLSGCPDVDKMTNERLNETMNCNAGCDCDLVRYSHVCSTDKTQAFISPCHAGCSQMRKLNNDLMVYDNCSCITSKDELQFGSATLGPCPVNCQKHVLTFVGLLCFVALISAMSKILNFLISIRCVEPRDKSVSLGLSLGVMSLLAMIPSPIVYGLIIDSACLLWNKTCSGTGNCWLLNSSLTRQRVVSLSLGFLAICVIVDTFIWWIMKDLNVFTDVTEPEGQDEKNDCITKDQN